MTDIKSELQRLRNAEPLERASVFQSICKNFSANTIAKALAEPKTRKKAVLKKIGKPGMVDRAGRPLPSTS